MPGQAAALASNFVATPTWPVDEHGAQMGIPGNPFVVTGSVVSPPIGTGNFATVQVSVGNTVTPIAAQRTGRTAVMIINAGTTDLWIGDAAVTIATGVLLPGVKGAALVLDTQAAVYGITATGTQTVSAVELY